MPTTRRFASWAMMLAVIVAVTGFTVWANPQQGPGEEKDGVYRVGKASRRHGP